MKSGSGGPGERLKAIPRQAVRLLVFAAGTTVLLLGLVLGPSFVLIPIGLAILSLEFAWARRLLRRARASVSHPLSRNAEVEAENAGNSANAQ